MNLKFNNVVILLTNYYLQLEFPIDLPMNQILLHNYPLCTLVIDLHARNVLKLTNKQSSSDIYINILEDPFSSLVYICRRHYCSPPDKDSDPRQDIKYPVIP